MPDISDFRFSLAPPSTLEGEAILTIAFTLSADFDAAAAPWVMFSTADGFVAGGFDIQSTDFTYDAAQNRFTLNYHMRGTAAEGQYFLREIDLFDKSGDRIVYTAAYFDQQGFDFIETLSNTYADNNAPTVENFSFTTPVFNAQTETWDVTARYDATDATGVAMADAYLSRRDGGGLYGPQAIKYSSMTVDGSHYEFGFTLPYFARSGDYSLLYIVNDNSNNTNAYMFHDSLPFVRIDNPNEDVTPPILENFSIKGEFISDGIGGLRPVLRVSGKLDVTSSGQSSTNLLVYSPDYTPGNAHYFDYFLGNVGDGSFLADIKLASPAPDGIYTFFLEAFDNAGNIARYASDALLPILPAGTLSLGQLGFATQVAVYAPDASYDPLVGISLTSTREGAIIFDGAGNDQLIGDRGNNDIVASGGDDRLSGGDGNDQIEGGSGNDTVDAGTGDDLIIGGSGAGDDVYIGGDGVDTVKYTSALAGITVDLTAGRATSSAGGDAAGIGSDTLSGIENVIAGNFGDTITGDALANKLEGKAGNDTLNGGEGSDWLDGGAGNDTLNGGGGTDTAAFVGRRSEYSITTTSTGYIVTDTLGRDGADTISNIEKLSFADQVLVLDTVSPTFTSAATSVNGLKVILTYNEALNATTAAKTAFAVKVAGVAATVSSVAVNGSTIELTLATAVTQGQVVTVGYTAPTANAATTNAAVQDTAGNDAVTLAATTAVTNNSTVDKTAPTFTSAATSADGLKVILTYNEALNATTAAKTAFAVKVAGVAATVSSVAVNGSTVELTLATAVAQGQAVTVGYAAPRSNAATTNAAVQDTAGNDAVKLAATTAVTNNSTVDKTAPAASTFTPTDGATGVALGSSLVMAFSEAIARGTGTITLRSGSATGTIVESFDAATSSRLTLLGATLTIDPTSDLASNTQYFVVFTSGNIKDTAGNAYAGISSYDFKTANIINGTANNDTLTGTSGADTINGLAGNDIITGGGGTDTMNGGDGADIYIIAAATDHAAAEIADTGASGTDEVRFTSTTANATLTLFAGDTGIEQAVIGTGTASTAVTTATTALSINASALAYSLTLIGNAGANTLTGGGGADTLQGGAGNDTLVGGAGADQLRGGAGSDTLTGGADADLFIFDTAANTTTNKDTITDFVAGTDKLQFSKAVFAGLSSATLGDLTTDAFWSGANVSSAHDATDRFIYNTTTGALFYDADGNATGSAAIQVALLGATVHPTLSYADIQVIG